MEKKLLRMPKIKFKELSEDLRKSFVEAQRRAKEKYPGIYEKYTKEKESKIDFICRDCGCKE